VEGSDVCRWEIFSQYLPTSYNKNHQRPHGQKFETGTPEYKLTCTTCERSYVGQTGSNLKQRYKEHIRYIQNNDPQSAYATHIINNLHEYGDINDNMSMLKQINKGPYINTLEQFYIQLFAYNNKLIPEQNTGDYSPIFRLIYDIQKR
jgi:hypothetical protein